MSYILRYPIGYKGVLIYGYLTEDGFHKWNSGLIWQGHTYKPRKELYDPYQAKRFSMKVVARQNIPLGDMHRYFQVVDFDKEVERYEIRRILQEIL